MKCPNCGHPERARVAVCPGCGQAYARDDLLALCQLEFLIGETASWEGAEDRLAPYLDRLEALRSRLVRPEPEPEAMEARTEVAPVPASVALPVTTPAPAIVAAAPVALVAPLERDERAPFDQWLLSERNIKIALYAGALLLVIAGTIFVGVNWMRIPGPGKFAITLLVTALTVVSGRLLYRRPSMRPGGVAVLAVACGFVALNFVVLQIYVLGPRGLADELMWLIASPFCLVGYLALAAWTRHELFAYLGLGAVASTAGAALTLAEAPLVGYLLGAALLGTALLPLVWRMRTASPADFAYRPLLYVTQGGMALVQPALFLYWLLATGCTRCVGGSPWLAIGGMGVGVFFYAGTEWANQTLIPRWASTGLFTLGLTAVLIEARIDQVLAAGLLMALALAQLVIGDRLQRRAEALAAGLPLYVAAASVAVLVTMESVADRPSLIEVLLADVALLALGARIFRQRWLGYAAVWLFMLPIYLLLDLNVAQLVTRGLLMGILGAIYGGTGALLVRRGRTLGWPFLTAAAFLSVVTVGLTWEAPAVASLVLVALVGVYLVVAEWFRWPWLMAPVYATVGTLPVTVYLLLLAGGIRRSVSQGLLLGALGLVYGAVAILLARRARRLAWPFLATAAVLSAVIVPLVWEVPVAAVPVLAAEAVLYGLAAAWLGWPPLLLPGLLAQNLALLAANLGLFGVAAATDAPLVISFAMAGWALVGVGRALVRSPLIRWSWPFTLAGAADASLALGAGMVAGDWLAVGVTAVSAVLLFAFAWWDRKQCPVLVFPFSPPEGESYPLPSITPLAAGAILVLTAAFHYLLDTAGGWRVMAVWPAYTAGLCGLYVALGWLLRGEELRAIYGVPFRYAGLLGMAIPPLAAMVTGGWGLVAVTLTIATLTYGAESAIRRSLPLVYLALGTLVLTIWASLGAREVSELQAYAVPLGVVLLGVGWNERRLRTSNRYVSLTGAGLLILLGSAFVQSLGRRGDAYALLMLVESVAAVGWGIRSRTRCYCQLGGVALLLNTLVQLGPAFLEFSRWVQIGTTGALLLGGGLLGLFKRDEILELRREMTDTWRQWRP